MKATSEFLKALSIRQPTLLLDKSRVTHNVDRLIAKAAELGVRLRPHFKTHQSAAVGEFFRGRGIEEITVSSVQMATYFAAHGWDDILIAIPANVLQVQEMNRLAGRIRLSLLIDSLAAVEELAKSLTEEVTVWVEIDTGHERTGVWYEHLDEALALVQAIQRAPQLTFGGLLTHEGQTYGARTAAKVLELHEYALERMMAVRAHLLHNEIEYCEISIGDTPSASLANEFPGVDELRPGNFVFYDLMQVQIGACHAEDIAVAVACPVIGKYPRRNEVAIYGGAVHLSKEELIEPGRRVYGYAAKIVEGGFGPALAGAPVVSLSQEHGILQMERTLFEEVDVGDLLLILPVHSCLTVNLYPAYTTLDGQQLPLMNAGT